MAAFDVLEAVRRQDAYANLVLPQVLAARRLSGRDAGFATELAAGALRRRGTYEAVLDRCLDRPLDKVQPAVLDVLVLGAHQLLGMRVPTHAAVGTSVDLVRARVGRGPTGFVNAVLRKVAVHDESVWLDRVSEAAPDETGRLAVRWSHPRWVVEELRAALGSPPVANASPPAQPAVPAQPDRPAPPDAPDGADELARLLAADNLAPRVTLVARPGLSEPAELLAAGGTPGRWSPYAVTLAGGDPGELTAVAQGRAGVQDEGSQLVALALAAADVPGRDERWLDLCAGPGGKSALLAALARQRGARLLATEVAAHRARLVARSTRGSGTGLLGVVVADGTVPAWRPGAFDRVLLDAPCSGLGALRRRPEARWRRQPEDLPALVDLQRRLLLAALDATRPGGVVLYATCSPVVAETAGVVTAVLEQYPGAEPEDATVLLPDVTDAASGAQTGAGQLWPHRHGTDAMFWALLRRR